jgi:hypothetical protein
LTTKCHEKFWSGPWTSQMAFTQQHQQPDDDTWFGGKNLFYITHTRQHALKVYLKRHKWQWGTWGMLEQLPVGDARGEYGDEWKGAKWRPHCQRHPVWVLGSPCWLRLTLKNKMNKTWQCEEELWAVQGEGGPSPDSSLVLWRCGAGLATSLTK